MSGGENEEKKIFIKDLEPSKGPKGGEDDPTGGSAPPSDPNDPYAYP